eukprot:INCI5002.4.p1 GENE.INCI5002.4~~INCI5002.4.p1  ORF type:complete len:206 (+),score=12.30 INCI5002.4:162-779(+)
MSSSESPVPVELCKLLIVGDTSVGKTSLMLRYTDGVFTDGTYLCTIGVDFRFKSVNVNKKTIRLQVCDTVGQSRFRTVARAQYRGIHGVLITFDLTCHKSFESVSGWIKDTLEYAPAGVQMIAVGTKADRKDKREVTETEIQEFVKRTDIPFFATSSKDGQGIDLLFASAAARCLKNAEMLPLRCSSSSVNTANAEPQPPARRGC